MLKKNSLLPLLLLTGGMLLYSPAAAGTFGPWDTDVAVGDAAIASRSNAHNVRAMRLTGPRNSVQGAVWFAVRLFQLVYSPQDSGTCRHKPTCSAYGREAVLRFGGIAGAVMAADRGLRCNPFSGGGHDPVPAINTKKNEK